jgi:hypothetical protein
MVGSLGSEVADGHALVGLSVVRSVQNERFAFGLASVVVSSALRRCDLVLGRRARVLRVTRKLWCAFRDLHDDGSSFGNPEG